MDWNEMRQRRPEIEAAARKAKRKRERELYEAALERRYPTADLPPTAIRLRACGRYGLCYVLPNGERVKAPGGLIRLSECLRLAQLENPPIFGLERYLKDVIAGKRDHSGMYKALAEIIGMSQLSVAGTVLVNYESIRNQWLLRPDQRQDIA